MLHTIYGNEEIITDYFAKPSQYGTTIETETRPNVLSIWVIILYSLKSKSIKMKGTIA